MINNTKRLIKPVLSLVFIFIFSVFIPFSSLCAETGFAAAADETAENFYIKKDSFSFIDAGSSACDWEAFTLARLGADFDSAGYLAVLSRNIERRYEKDGCLDKVKSTEWQRCALTVSALGGDPRNVYILNKTRPVNLINDGIFYRGREKAIDAQGLNGVIFALITLNSGEYETPADAVDTKETLLNKLLAAQLPNGGFALDGSEPDADMTAMALCALSGCGDEFDVAGSIKNGLGFLSRVQLEDGGYDLRGTVNCESAAQVIIALTSLGIDPESDERFIKEKGDPVAALLSFRTPDGFIHSYSGGADGENTDAGAGKVSRMATWQAALALCALERFRAGDAPVYAPTGTEPYYKYESGGENSYVSALKKLYFHEKGIELGEEEYKKALQTVESFEAALDTAAEVEKEIDGFVSNGVGLGDWFAVNFTEKKIKSLDEELKNRIPNLPDFDKIRAQADEAFRTAVIFIICAAALIISVTAFVISKKKKKKKNREADF